MVWTATTVFPLLKRSLKALQKFTAASKSSSNFKVWSKDHLWSARPWRQPAPLYHLWPHLESSNHNQNPHTDNSFQFESGFIFCVQWVQIQFIRLFQSSRTRVLPHTGERQQRLTTKTRLWALHTLLFWHLHHLRSQKRLTAANCRPVGQFSLCSPRDQQESRLKSEREHGRMDRRTDGHRPLFYSFFFPCSHAQGRRQTSMFAGICSFCVGFQSSQPVMSAVPA